MHQTSFPDIFIPRSRNRSLAISEAHLTDINLDTCKNDIASDRYRHNPVSEATWGKRANEDWLSPCNPVEYSLPSGNTLMSVA